MMDDTEVEQAVLDEMEEQQEDAAEDNQEEQFINQEELRDAYGSMEQEKSQNQHSFLKIFNNIFF